MALWSLLELTFGPFKLFLRNITLLFLVAWFRADQIHLEQPLTLQAHPHSLHWQCGSRLSQLYSSVRRWGYTLSEGLGDYAAALRLRQGGGKVPCSTCSKEQSLFYQNTFHRAHCTWFLCRPETNAIKIKHASVRRSKLKDKFTTLLPSIH